MNLSTFHKLAFDYLKMHQTDISQVNLMEKDIPSHHLPLLI